MFENNSHSFSPTKIKTETIEAPSFAMDFENASFSHHSFCESLPKKTTNARNRYSHSSSKRSKETIQRSYSSRFTTPKELPSSINNETEPSHYSKFDENDDLDIYNAPFCEEEMKSSIVLDFIHDQNDGISQSNTNGSSFSMQSSKEPSLSTGPQSPVALFETVEPSKSKPRDASIDEKGTSLQKPDDISFIPSPSPSPFSTSSVEPSCASPKLKKELEVTIFPQMLEVSDVSVTLSDNTPNNKTASTTLEKNELKENTSSHRDGPKKKKTRRNTDTSLAIAKIPKKRGRRPKRRNTVSQVEEKTRKSSDSEYDDCLGEIPVQTGRSMPRRWTDSDDDKVAFLREYGNLKWHEVTEFINGRHTPQAVQMRYLRSLKRRNDKLTPEESTKLRRLVVEDYESRFKRLSTAMGPSFTPVRIQKIFLTQGGLADTLGGEKKWTRDEIVDLVDQAGGDFDNFTVPVRSDELPPQAKDHMKDKYTKSYEELVSLYIGVEDGISTDLATGI